MEIASQGRVHCSGGCVGCQSSARAAGDETDTNIDRDRHDPAPEILLDATLLLELQRPNSWHDTITNIGLVDRRK